MSEDVENGWPMDQDGDRHEGALMEDEEEGQEQRQRRARYHDDEDEEDEDEEEEAEGPSKKRRKASKTRYFRLWLTFMPRSGLIRNSLVSIASSIWRLK